MFNKEKHSTILLAPHLGDISINFVPLRQSGTGALSKHAQSGQGRRSFFLWTLALSIPVLYLCQQLLQHLEAGNDTEHTHLLPQHILGSLTGIPLSTTLSLAIGLTLVLLVLFACGKGRRTMPDHLRKTAMTICRCGRATAEDISQQTSRARAVESAYLNQLVIMGYLKKERKGRKAYFYIEKEAQG